MLKSDTMFKISALMIFQSFLKKITLNLLGLEADSVFILAIADSTSLSEKGIDSLLLSSSPNFSPHPRTQQTGGLQYVVMSQIELCKIVQCVPLSQID
jgi:hypothetical protein